MKEGRDKRFLSIMLPLLTAAFLAVATVLYFLPEFRLHAAERALARGEFDRVEAWIGSDQSDRAIQLSDTGRLQSAEDALERGDSATARQILLTMPENEQVKSLLRACDYWDAVQLTENGEYERALERWMPLAGYRDSHLYADRCRMELAERQYAAGQAQAAALAFLEIGSDAAIERATEIAKAFTGCADAGEALDRIRGWDEAAIERQKQLERRRQAASGILAVGFSHTVGLLPNGAAIAAGDDTYGQCMVSDWSNLIGVDAGAYHTVGLRADGTVVAVGDNTYGQCAVSDWTDVVAIAVNNYDTAALTASGRILHTGFHAYAETADWPDDLVSIAAGAYGLAALRRNGTMLATHESSRATEFSGMVGVDVQTGYAIGWMADGTVQGHGVTLPDWEEVVIMAAGSNRILALTLDGTVLEHPFLERDRLLLRPESDVIAIANGGTHIALLHADGTVVCYGENPFGECDTGAWRLQTSP